MPGFVPFTNVARASVEFQLAGQQCVHVLHFQAPSAITTTLMDSLNTALANWWATQYRGFAVPEQVLAYIRTQDLSSISSPVRTLVISPGTAGTHAFSMRELNAACVMTLRTQSRGRSYRGRVYVPASAQPGTFGIMHGTWLGNIATAFAWLMTNTNIANWTWGIASRWLNKTLRSSGVFTPITAVTTDQYIDSSRRRLIGRGV